MSETVPGGFYLQGEVYVDSEGQPVKNEVLERAGGAALARLPEKKLAELKLTPKQKDEIKAELDRREAEVLAEEAQPQLQQLGQLLEKASRVVPATAKRPEQQTAKRSDL